MVGNHFGVGWTFNLANPTAWLIIAGIAAVPAGLYASTGIFTQAAQSSPESNEGGSRKGVAPTAPR